MTKQDVTRPVDESGRSEEPKTVENIRNDDIYADGRRPPVADDRRLPSN